MSRGSRRRAIGYSQVSELRKLLRRIEKDIREGGSQEVQDAISESARLAESTMKSLAPRKTGEMAASIRSAIAPDGLSALVGPGVKGAKTVKRKTGTYGSKAVKNSKTTEKDLFQMYKAYWLEVGTKKMSDKKKFVQPTRDLIKDDVIKKIDDAVKRVLSRLRGKGKYM